MTHRDVIPMLADLLANLVAEPEATEAWAHVAGCADCREAVTAMHEIRAAVARAGAEVFSTHPSSREIVLFALDDPGLGTDERLGIEAHLRACASCNNEILLTRKADKATRRGGSGPISLPGGGIAWLAPALAVMLAVLAYPAFVGLVRHPGLVRAHDAASRRLEALRQEQSRLSGELSERRLADHGGPARLLYLPATTRGGGPLATVTLLAGQAWQPVVIQHRPFAGTAPSGSVDLEVVREADGAVTWRATLPAVEAWDTVQAAMVLLLPTSTLESGSYRLSVRGTHGAPYEGRFRVAEAGR